jgi:hypothetical protein
VLYCVFAVVISVESDCVLLISVDSPLGSSLFVCVCVVCVCVYVYVCVCV